MRGRAARQRGITLVFALVMLVLLTMLALSSVSIGRTSLQVTDNAQQQAQVLNAAHTVLQQVLSSPGFTTAPDKVFDHSNCGTGSSTPGNTRCVDLQGGGKTVITVSLQPQPACVRARVLPVSELDVEKAEDLGCTLGQNQNFGVEGLMSGTSLCADSTWMLQAQAQDAVTGANARVSQGVSMRVAQTAMATHCP